MGNDVVQRLVDRERVRFKRRKHWIPWDHGVVEDLVVDIDIAVAGTSQIKPLFGA
jgi:hypothetical protein